ncbi:MAG: universal stress protein, partial [Gammaproteobacteria bacterium]|nr:universal stress protein [Gammaproteobacteria bacterium]
DCRAALTVAEVLTDATSVVDQGVSCPDELDEEMTESRRRRLEERVARLREDGDLEVRTKVLVGKPHEEVVREVVANGRDLVLKTAQDGHALKARIFGDDDTRLLKICPCPVLLLRSIPPKPYRHRLVCAGVYQDEHPGSHRDDRYAVNRRILEHASWVATAQFAELHIVHAWEAYGEQHMRSGRSPLHFEADDYVQSEQDRNRKALDRCLAELNESTASDALPPFKPVCHLVKGSHRDEIVRLAASMKADLVVVGGLAHSGITGFIADSTAESIARYLNCSVLVVKPPDFVTPVIVEDP